MQHLQELHVVITHPGSLSRDIATNNHITINFNLDLHTRHISDTVIVRCLETDFMDAKLEDPGVAARSTNVPGVLTYANRTLVFAPSHQLKPDMVYNVMVVSNANTLQGVRSVLGRFMVKNHSFVFKTAKRVALNPIDLLTPSNNSVIRQAPTFTWKEAPGIRYYNLEVSRSNIFRTIHWSNCVDSSVTSPPLTPGVHFDESLFAEDGIYYWRIQAVSWDHDTSEFSAVYQFHIDRATLTPIHPDDDLVNDPAKSESNRYIEVIEVFPEDEFSNVALNLKTIYVKMEGDFDPTQLTRTSFEVKGQLVESGVAGTSHEEVQGTYVIANASDGTWLISFLPAPILT